jgi:RNA polymerase sigma factor (sigma-70 family)
VTASLQGGYTADDADLVRGAVEGDEQAWELIIRRYTNVLVSVGRSHRLSADEVSDALQDTWLRAVVNLAALRDADRLGPWLCTIMRRRCLNQLSRRRRRGEHLVADAVAFDVVDECVDVENEAVATEWSAMLRAAIAELPHRERQLVRELAVDDPSYDQLAHRLSMPRGSVGPTRMRALRRLRLILEETHGTDFARSA